MEKAKESHSGSFEQTAFQLLESAFHLIAHVFFFFDNFNINHDILVHFKQGLK